MSALYLWPYETPSPPPLHYDGRPGRLYICAVSLIGIDMVKVG
jgi:hypothetical protein